MTDKKTGIYEIHYNNEVSCPIIDFIEVNSGDDVFQKVEKLLSDNGSLLNINSKKLGVDELSVDDLLVIFYTSDIEEFLSDYQDGLEILDSKKIYNQKIKVELQLMLLAMEKLLVDKGLLEGEEKKIWS